MSEKRKGFQQFRLKNLELCGAGDRTRTCGERFGRPTLYQLSYTRTSHNL